MLNSLIAPEEEADTQLPVPAVLVAFTAGFLCVISPLPQLLAGWGHHLSFWGTAYLSTLCGIGAMSGILFRYGGAKIFQIRRLTWGDILFCLKGTALIIPAYALVNALWKALLTLTGIPFEETQQLMIFAQNISGFDFVLLAILVTIPVPVAEELLFRRILYGGVVRQGRMTALLFTSFFFAAVHFFLAGFPGLFVIGAGCQLIYLKRKNLLAAILSHALLNACAVLSAALSTGV